MTNEEIKAFYNENIFQWVKYNRIDVRKKYLGLLDLSKDSLLDVGCGCGLDMSLIAKLGIRCHGIDFSSEALGIARESNSLYSNTSFECADFMTYTPHRKYDIVLFSMLIMHYSNLSEVYRKLKSFMNDNGQLLLVTNNPYNISMTYNLPYDSTESVKYNHEFIINGRKKIICKYNHPITKYINEAYDNGLILQHCVEISSYSEETYLFNPIVSPFPNFLVFSFKN